MQCVHVCESVCVCVYSPCTLCVHSEGWADPHTMCPVSVATNWISLDLQCWANRSVAADELFNVSAAFSGTGAGARGELRRSARSWRRRLTSSSDLLSSCASVDLSVSFFSFPCPPLSLFVVCLSTALPERRACPRFNCAEVKRWWGENEVSWFWCFAVNDGKLQCGRQWLEACCTSARGRGEQREGDGKGYIISYHQFSSLWLSVCSCICAYTHLSVSLTPFPLCHITCSLLRRCGRWKG